MAAKKAKPRGRPFKKGQSGNPSGRSKKQREIESICQDLCEQRDPATKRTLLEEIACMARDVENKPADRIRAAEVILAYGYGKPRQRVEMTAEVVAHEDALRDLD